MRCSDLPDFASRLRYLRRMQGLSQRMLALACGISCKQQRAYESGLKGLDAQYLHALAAVGLEVAYLTTGEFPPPLPNGMDRGTFIFLDNYRNCSPEAQAEIQLTLMIAAAPALARRGEEDAHRRRQQLQVAANDE